MNYPRPTNDNGWGLHDDGVSGPGTMPRMYSLIDEMQDKNVHWLTLVMNVTREKQPLIRYAQDRNIMVLVRPFEQPCHPKSRIPEWFIKACMDHGAHYFIDWNEPNLGGVECNKPYNEYKYNGVPDGHEAFVNRLLDQWLTDADTVRKCGGIPLLFPMSPTAYTSNDVYFHHRLYNELIALAQARGCLWWAFEGTGIAIHNRPCDGMPLDKEDRCAYDDYRWIEERFKNALGYEIPLFGSESGYESGMVTAHLANYHGLLQPNSMTILEYHKRLNHEIFARMNPAHPKAWRPYLICQNLWLSHDGPADWPGSGYKLNQLANGEAPAWRDMHELPYFTRAEGADVDPPPPPPPPDVEFFGLTDEMIERLRIIPSANPDEPYWKVVRVAVDASLDKMSVFAMGKPLSPTIRFYWADGEQVVEQAGDLYAPFSPCAQMPMFSAWGGYCAQVYNANSESLEGFGLYGDNYEITHTAHHPTMIWFKWVEDDPEPPPEPPEPPEPPMPPEPPPDIGYTLKRRLEMNPHGFEDLRSDIEAISDMATLNDEARRDAQGNPLFHQIQTIVVHHSGNEKPHTPLGIAHWAIETCTEIDHPTAPYHFMVDKSGKVYWTARLVHVTRHTYGLNEKSIAVTALGHYEHEEPPEAQMEGMRFVIAALYEFVGQDWGEFRLLGLVPHREVRGNSTVCPGLLWPLGLWSGPWPKLVSL